MHCSHDSAIHDAEVKIGIWDALRNLVQFVQLKKREKHPRRSVTFSKVAD